MDKQNSVIEMIHEAIDLYGDENYSAAISLLTKAISLDANNSQAYFERAMALLELDQDSDAIADFDRALEIDPNDSGARDWRAKTLAALGDFQQAAEEKLKVLRDNPDGKHEMGVSPQSWADCAKAFIDAGDHNTAKELLEEYFSQHAAKVENYARYETAPMRMLSKLLIQSGETQSALEFSQKAYQSSFRNPADILSYALALEASGDIETAKEKTAEAMNINDQMPGVRELSERLS